MQYFIGGGVNLTLIVPNINHVLSVILFMDVDVIKGIAEQHGCVGTLF